MRFLAGNFHLSTCRVQLEEMVQSSTEHQHLCDGARAEVDVRVQWRKTLEMDVQRVSPLNCAVYSETTGVIMSCSHDVCRQVILSRQQ